MECTSVQLSEIFPEEKNIKIVELIQQILNELESISSVKGIKTEIRRDADTPESAALYGDEGTHVVVPLPDGK